jgi:serine/threonine-protein kinase ULK4
VERVSKDTFKYIQSCLYYLVDAIGEITLKILTDIGQDLSRSSRSSLSLAPVILHAVNCAPVKARFPYKSYIVSLAALIRSGLSESQPSNEEFQRVLILILESLSSNPKALSSNAEVIFNNLLPELLVQQRNSISQTRFMCLKVFSDILITMLTDESVYDPASSKVYTQSANELITKSLLPLYSQLLADEDPIPLYAIKLLSVILDQMPQTVSVLHRLNLIGVVIEDFHAESHRLNAHLVKAVRTIVESKELTLSDFEGFGLVEKVGSVMEMVQQKDQDWCIESLLNIVYELLFSTADLLRRENSEATLSFAEPLVQWFPLCVKFMSTGEASVQERSMHCVALMLQLYGKT